MKKSDGQNKGIYVQFWQVILVPIITGVFGIAGTLITTSRATSSNPEYTKEQLIHLFNAGLTLGRTQMMAEIGNDSTNPDNFKLQLTQLLEHAQKTNMFSDFGSINSAIAPGGDNYQELVGVETNLNGQLQNK